MLVRYCTLSLKKMTTSATKSVSAAGAVSCGRINADKSPLYPFEDKSDNWGYFDGKGKTVIKPKFYQAEQFSEGLAAVCVSSDWLEEKWGYINKKGEIVIEPRFREAEAFKDGFAQVIENDTSARGWHYSFINTKGETLFSWWLDDNSIEYESSLPNCLKYSSSSMFDLWE